jgi:hypothetical protein
MDTGIHVSTLDDRVQQLPFLEAVEKRELAAGDWVFVTTKNSVYAICVLGGGQYSVSGGWFDRVGNSPQRVGINGCTWGGSLIKEDIVAARGLFLEFANRVLTTRIQDVRVVHGGLLRLVN